MQDCTEGAVVGNRLTGKGAAWVRICNRTNLICAVVEAPDPACSLPSSGRLHTVLPLPAAAQAEPSTRKASRTQRCMAMPVWSRAAVCAGPPYCAAGMAAPAYTDSSLAARSPLPVCVDGQLVMDKNRRPTKATKNFCRRS